MPEEPLEASEPKRVPFGFSAPGALKTANQIDLAHAGNSAPQVRLPDKPVKPYFFDRPSVTGPIPFS